MAVPWTRVTKSMCKAGNPLRGKHLYFPRPEATSGKEVMCFPPGPEAKVIVLGRGNERSVHDSFSFGCAKTYPKLQTVYMFSDPGGTQRSFSSRGVRVFFPACFSKHWTVNPSTSPLSLQECNDVLEKIEGRIKWQDHLQLVHTELRYRVQRRLNGVQQ